MSSRTAPGENGSAAASRREAVYDVRARFAEYIATPMRIAISRHAPATAVRQPQPIVSQNVETRSAGTAIISSPLFIFSLFFSS